MVVSMRQESVMIDIKNLTEEEQMKLQEIHAAYTRTYPPAMNWRDYERDGFDRVDYTKCGLNEIQEGMDEIEVMSTFHLNDEGVVVPGEGTRASWIERRINRWSRR